MLSRLFAVVALFALSITAPSAQTIISREKWIAWDHSGNGGLVKFQLGVDGSFTDIEGGPSVRATPIPQLARGLHTLAIQACFTADCSAPTSILVRRVIVEAPNQLRIIDAPPQSPSRPMSRQFVASEVDYVLGTDGAGVTPTGSAWTAGAWIKLSSAHAGKFWSKWHDQGDPGAFEWLLSVNSSRQIVTAIHDGSDFRIITGGTALALDTWYHIILRQNGTGAGTLELFVNGASDGTATTSAAPQNTTTPAKIGSGGNGATHDEPFDGLISRPFFTNATAASAGQITSLQTQSPDDVFGVALTFYAIDTANELVDYAGGMTLTNNGSAFSSDEPFSEVAASRSPNGLLLLGIR